MKQRSILVTFLLCVLLLTGCGTAAPAPDATPTPTQEAAAAPTPTPDPLSTLPYEDGQLYAAAYLGYLEPKDLDFFRQTYFGGRPLLSASGSSVLAQTTAPTRCISARFAACTASVTEDVQSESTTAS